MKSAKRILCAFLAVLTLLTLAAAGSVRPAYAAKTAAELEEEQRKAAQIAALEQKKKEQQEKLKELEKQIAEAKAKKEDVMVTKNLLDQRNQLLLEQIDDTQNQIDDAAAQIARYELLEQEQYELFCQQVRSEEERGSLSYLSVLFKATSMADLLNRMEFVNEVAEYNKTLIAAMKETRENIKAEKTEMEAKEAKLGEQQDELQGKLDETTKLMNEYAADQRELEKLYAAEEAAGKAIVAEINRLMAESDVVPSAEGFIWPVTTSKMISSPQGNRVSPGNGIGSSNHKGVDICNVSYSSKIYATKSGKVLIASMPYSDKDGGKSGYGNYVVIDHGGGMSTLYAHMSIVKVSVGQYVSQGDVIGVTGNTGASTGPHLHYEVHSTTMVNGRAVTVYENPLNYLPGYIAAW
ncbi:MAG: peptidoglycan DD-metalloendopeptidase family protein [Vescimonas sp.]|uniref:murein hydrolase activator EnvC family protein n=1 Tax=Vescimonas sp. TaxID=2892404 RepID=UPI002A91EE70|nr:peptidoglycan DD-metalloendopeptidase family protein [Vescimonas sp.]MCI6678368.1 peptidoglycan DD-metalloendopeptidase family protein [Oscillibacter sp.]MDY5334720.1 peptidoglycan DD-metalloendopeptidase family protein [Vescimonas sp.]